MSERPTADREHLLLTQSLVGATKTVQETRQVTTRDIKTWHPIEYHQFHEVE
jgi:hypothetical protein